MYKLFHIYGPIYVHSFGLMIVVGLFIFATLIKNHADYIKVTKGLFSSTLLMGIFAGIVGGRILYIATSWDSIEHWTEIFNPLVPGFSMLGSVLSILALVPLYLRLNKIAILPFFDLVAIYAPILQATIRVGCYLAGCCYGKITTLPWSVMYTSDNTVAPTCIPMHPTQLYSSSAGFLIFLLMYFVFQRILEKPGQLLMTYLILVNAERFIVDFFRGDQEFFASPMLRIFSVHQWIALATIGVSCILLLIFSFKPTHKES